MFNLFLHEFKRYQLIACITALLLTAIMATLSGIQPIMAKGLEVLAYHGFALILGFALGCTQVLLHKRKGQWAYLVHRPMSPRSIFISLVSAGLLTLAIAVAIPLFLVFLGLDLFNIDIVEPRHYLATLHVYLSVVFVYLVGLYVALSPNKGAFLCLALLYYISSSDPNSAALTFIVDIILVTVMLLLGASAFKVNLSEHHQSITSRLLAVSALHMGIMVVLMLGQMIFYHLPMSMLDKHPDNFSKQELNDSFALLWQLTPEELIDVAVDEANYPKKSVLKQQIKHAKNVYLDTKYQALAHLEQLFHHDNDAYALVDATNKQHWIFSHKHQVFIGKDSKNQQLVGYLTRSGFLPANTNVDSIAPQTRFSSVPRIHQNKFIQEYDRIYVVDFVGQHIDSKHQLPGGEHYVNRIQQPQDANSFVLVSNRAIYVFDDKKFTQPSSATLPKMVIEHPKPYQPMRYVQAFDMLDGYLLKFADRHYFGFDKPGVALFYAKLDGERILVAEKAFEYYRPMPSWVSYQSYWMSPLVYSVLMEVAEDVFRHKDDPSKQTFATVWNKEYPPPVYWLITINLLITSLLTLYLGWKFNKKKSDITFWLMVVIVFGLPGFCSFLLMNHWREFLAAKARRTPSNTPLTTAPIKV